MSTEGVRWKSAPYIRMHSGRIVHLNDPRPESYYIPDVAYHMAGINRYTGGSRFTNGQHSIVAAEMARRFYPGGLLPQRMAIHDTAEHVLGDVSSPLKSMLPEYKELEARWDLAAETRFGVTFVGDPLVKEVDDRMWLTERLVVYPMLKQTDDYLGPLEPFPLSHEELMEWFAPWHPDEVEFEMLAMFARLFPQLEDEYREAA